MAMNLGLWSTTPANNATVGSINFAEQQAPSTVNNSARQAMADIRDWYDQAEWIDGGYSISYVSATMFKFHGTDRTALAPAGRRVRAGVGAGTIYGTITAASLSASDTQITVAWDSGSLDASLSAVALGILHFTNQSSPRGQVFFPATQIASTNANCLDDYDEYTAASAACSGAITTAAVWGLVKIGNVVTLKLPAVTGAGVATNYFEFGTKIPAKYRPGTDKAFIMAQILNNNVIAAASGYILVQNSDGAIRVYLDAQGTNNFTVTTNAGLNTGTSVSWVI